MVPDRNLWRVWRDGGQRALIAALGAFGLLAGHATADAAAEPPKPSATPITWEFDIEVSPLRVIEVADDENNLDAYFYLTFFVRNETDRERFFAPVFELTTDRGEVLQSDQQVPRAVAATLRERQRNPLLLEQFAVIGELGVGDENAKEGIAIWRVGEEDLSSVSVYVSGLSGETRTIKVRKVEKGKVVLKDVLLRKTLMLRHEVQGNLLDDRSRTQRGKTLARAETEWIMRRPLATIAARAAEQREESGNDAGS